MKNLRKGASLFSHLVLAFCCVALLMVVLFGAVAYSYGHNRILANAHEDLRRIRKEAQSYFQQTYSEHITRDLNFLTTSPTLDAYLRSQKAEKFITLPLVERLFLQFSRSYQDIYMSIHLIDSQAIERISIEGTRRNRKLQALSPDSPNLLHAYSFALFNRLKNEPIGTLLIEGPFDWHGKTQIIAGMGFREPEAGGFGGVIIIESDLDNYIRYIKDIRYRGHSIATLESIGHSAEPHPHNDKSELVDCTLLTLGDQQQPVLELSLSIPDALLYQDIFGVLTRILAVAALGFLIVMLVAFLLSRVLSKPISSLVDATKRIAEGDLGVQIKIKSNREVEELVHHFNQMTETLSKNMTSIDNLNKEIAERKKAESALLRAKEQAEQATRAKSEFLANMSHEIRTPLNAIIGTTELMMLTPQTVEQRDYVQTLKGGSETLLHVINDILDYSKIESGHLELESRPFELRPWVEDTVEMFAPQAARKDIELICNIDHTIPAGVIGDSTRIRQILANLLTNAIKFTQKGEVELALKHEAITADKHHLHFTVRDTGIGIPEAKLDTIFESFSQADMSTTREFGGTGLGLSISKQLATLMGGSLWVESKQGVGSTFHFEITLQEAALEARDKTKDTHHLSGKRMLLVDDNRVNLKILCKQLELWNVTTECIDQPEKALERLKAGEPFDLIILDQMMPGMSGTELWEAFKKHNPERSLPGIILSSAGRIPYSDQLEQDERLLFLLKPVKQSKLFDAILSLLSDGAEIYRQDSGWNRERASKLSGTKILLVEDNKVNQRVMGMLLQKLGCTDITIANNGSEAVQTARETNYDLIFMDCQMPVLDGYAATRQLRAEETTKHVKIIALTAHAMQGDKEKCLAAGMDDYLPKPVTFSSLEAIVERTLGKS